MEQLKHIKISPYKALKENCLENLSQINVICGKNNSGKTTLLEAIKQTKDKNVLGVTVTDEQIQEFQVAWSNKSSDWRFTFRNGDQLFSALFQSFEFE